MRQKLLGALLLGVVDELAGRAFLHHDAAVHEQDAVGHVPGEVHLMGDDDHGGLSVGEVAQDTEDFAGQLRVEGAGGLIEAEDVRVERQRAGDGHPLLLTAGELVGVVACPLRQAHLGQQVTGLCFQNFNLFPQYTALENVMLAGELLAKEQPGYKANKKAIHAQLEQQARELLAQMGLSERAGHYPHQLSGGQQQRVAIARALALHPDILCFDEPTSALDPELTGEVLRVLRDLADRKTTMIIVTHEMNFARDVADRILFMDGGVVVEQGPARQLIEHPQEERTRRFLAHYSE